MLKAVTWCAKCLFLYFLVAVAAIRFYWILTTPIWQMATKWHLTNLNRVGFVLSYFLPVFAVTGFLLGLVPFGKFGKALGDLFRSLAPSASVGLTQDADVVPPILWAWLPVTIAFLIRFATWQSRASSVFDAHRSTGRIERFFGPLSGQTTSLLDNKWLTDRFLFTGPMLFLIACALAALLRYRLSIRKPQPQTGASNESD